MRTKVLIITGLLAIAGACYVMLSQTGGKATDAPPPEDLRPLDARELTYQGASFDVLRIDPAEWRLRLFWKDASGRPYGNFENLRAALEAEDMHLRFATNAGIFSEDHTPGGLHIEDGTELKSLNLRDGGGNFHLKPNGVFLLGAEGAGVLESGQFEADTTPADIATQSGPMLVINDRLHPAFREASVNRHLRSGVGVDREGRIHFAISNERINFFDFASMFRDALHCPDALYLDGNISQFYLPELDRYDTGGDFCGILAIVE